MTRKAEEAAFDVGAWPRPASFLDEAGQAADFPRLLDRIGELGQWSMEARSLEQHIRAYCKTVSMIANQDRFGLSLRQALAFADHYMHGFLNGLYGLNATTLRKNADRQPIASDILDAVVELGRCHAKGLKLPRAGEDRIDDGLSCRSPSQKRTDACLVTAPADSSHRISNPSDLPVEEVTTM